jgi:hypothetical protein
MVRCLAIDVLLLCAYACAGMCLPSGCLAMDLYVTIYMYYVTAVLHEIIVPNINLNKWQMQ